jgi:enterobacteria phage integrase
MAMGRQRSKARIGWPANLYASGTGYKYRHPGTRKEHWMGTDRARAFDAAKKLNALLMHSNSLVDKVIGRGETIAAAIRTFRAEDMPGRQWAPKTADLYENILKRTEAAIGDRELVGFGVRDCATFIRDITESPRARQQFRLALQWVLACAVEEGWIDTNPALQTRKASYQRQRDRLTRHTYEAIWQHAEPWLQRAMDLSLITLLRREDIVSAKFADIRDGALWIIPSKTETSTGARLKLPLDGDLAELVTRCRDAVVSPYLIHRLPEKARPTGMRAKTRDHHTQVLPEQLSRAFADARDAAKLESENPPTFHEIRSLGAALLIEQGWTRPQVQALMCHSEAAMTDLYLGGHEQPWTEIKPGLVLTR